MNILEFYATNCFRLGQVLCPPRRIKSCMATPLIDWLHRDVSRSSMDSRSTAAIIIERRDEIFNKKLRNFRNFQRPVFKFSYNILLSILKRSHSLIFCLCHEREARYTGHNRAKRDCAWLVVYKCMAYNAQITLQNK